MDSKLRYKIQTADSIKELREALLELFDILDAKT